MEHKKILLLLICFSGLFGCVSKSLEPEYTSAEKSNMKLFLYYKDKEDFSFDIIQRPIPGRNVIIGEGGARGYVDAGFLVLNTSSIEAEHYPLTLEIVGDYIGTIVRKSIPYSKAKDWKAKGELIPHKTRYVSFEAGFCERLTFILESQRGEEYREGYSFTCRD